MSINLPYVEGTSNCEKNEIMKHCWEANYNFSWDQKKKKMRITATTITSRDLLTITVKT